MNHQRPFSLSFLFAALLLALTSVPVSAQSATATLSGTVTDQNGAVVPNATVTIINNATLLKRDTVTNDEGSFTIPLLQPGNYTVRAQHDGFTIAQIDNVVLNVGDQKSIQIPLQTGDVSETVNVTGEASLIDTSGAVGTVIDRQFVQNIPLNGRSFQTLFELTPGVIMIPAGNSGTGDGQFSVNGQRGNTNYFTVDGVSANTAIGSGSGGWVGKEASGQLPGLTASGTTASLVSVDALQEFRIQTSSYSPEFGRQPGGQVSLVTRSGGNTFHGGAFDYIRNEAFDANNWFNNRNNVKRPPMRQHLYGGTFSGPLYFPRFGEGGRRLYSGKNRTFFFFSYEGLRLRLPKGTEINVPTLCLRGEATCSGALPALPQYQPFLKSLPKPNGPEVFVTCTPGPADPLCSPQTRTKPSGYARFAASYSDPSSYDATALRIDHTVGKMTFFGRFSYTPSKSTTRSQSGLSSTQTSTQNNTSFTAGSTWSASKGVVNDIRYNYTVTAGPFSFAPDDFGGAVPLSTFGFQGRNSVTSLYTFSLSGVPGNTLLGQWGALTVYKQRQTNIVDNLLVQVGNHQLKFGVDFRRSNPRLLPGENAGIERLFFAAADLTSIGRAAAYSITSLDGDTHAAAFNNLSIYAQDTWKVNRRLTLTYGVRWEFVPPPHATEGPDGPVLTGLDAPLTPNHVGIARSGTPLWNTRYFNFAPRIGASYLVVDRPGRELVVRGGTGIFYDLGLGSIADSFGLWPFRVTNTFPLSGHPVPACAGTTVSFPLPACALIPPVPSRSTVPANTIEAVDPDFILPRTYQWNLSAEQSIGTNQTVTISYVGAFGRELLKTDNYSSIRLIGFTYPGTTASTIGVQRNGGYSDYQSLQVQFQRRLSRGLQGLVSYTLGRSRDTNSSDGGPSGFSIPNELVQPEREYGYSSFDVRHILTAAATYQIPPLKSNTVLRAITRDWSIDMMFRARTGSPLNPNVTRTFPGAGNFAVRANVVPGQPFWIDDPASPGGRRLNLLAFSVPPQASQGDLPRNLIHGFGAKQVDLSLRRDFPLSEKIRLQLRAEAYNVFNTPNFANPSGLFSATTTASSYGATTSLLNTSLGGLNALYQIGGPRSMQFAARISF